MDVVKDCDALVSDLRRRIQNGDESCRPLLAKAEAAMKEVREKESPQARDPHGR